MVLCLDDLEHAIVRLEPAIGRIVRIIPLDLDDVYRRLRGGPITRIRRSHLIEIAPIQMARGDVAEDVLSVQLWNERTAIDKTRRDAVSKGRDVPVLNDGIVWSYSPSCLRRI